MSIDDYIYHHRKLKYENREEVIKSSKKIFLLINIVGTRFTYI